MGGQNSVDSCRSWLITCNFILCFAIFPLLSNYIECWVWFGFISEDKVLSYYKSSAGQSRGETIVRWVNLKISHFLEAIILTYDAYYYQSECFENVSGSMINVSLVTINFSFLRYLCIFQSLPTYGVHYYEVKVRILWLIIIINNY